MTRTRGNILAVISRRAAAKLRRLAIHPDVYCHHITMTRRDADDATFRKYARLAGKRIIFSVTGIYADEMGQAARVFGVASENEYPHITISCAPGVPPKYSNELLAKKRLRGKGFRMRGYAVVQIVRE